MTSNTVFESINTPLWGTIATSGTHRTNDYGAEVQVSFKAVYYG